MNRRIEIVGFLIIWSCLALIAQNRPQENPSFAEPQGVRGMRFPALSPDGSKIAFALHGDLWVVAVEGGKAARLTLHEAEDTRPRWSPDGKSIAFSSERSGNFDVWVTSAEGGVPRQVTFDQSEDTLTDWSADGEWLLFFSNQAAEGNLWKIPARGGLALQVSLDGGGDGRFAPDGRQVVYTKGSGPSWIKNYRGSGNWDIFTASLAGGAPKQLTSHGGNDLSPFYSPDGKTIYFLSEHELLGQPAEDRSKGGPSSNKSAYNLWQIPSEGGTPQQVTALDTDLHTPALSRDGKSLFFERDFYLWRMFLSSGEIAQIVVELETDELGGEDVVQTLTQGAEQGSWSPDSAQIVFVLRGDIWLMSALGGMARQLTSGPARDEWPRFSPDGQRIAYCSDKAGNSDIYLLSLADGSTVQVTQEAKNDFYHSWSPDGKELLFTSERTGNREIWVMSASGENPRQLTNSPAAEDDAVYSPDGQWIAFDSGKSGNQEIWLMPAQGTYSQARRLTNQGGLTQVPGWSPDSKWIAYETNDSQGNASIWVIAREGGPAMQVVSRGSLPGWSPDGRLILYEDKENDEKNLHVIEAPVGIHLGRRLPLVAQMEVNKRAQRALVFAEAWKAIEKDFYDPAFHGVDWPTVVKKYEPLAQEAYTNGELRDLLNRMLSELRASHTGIFGPALRNKVSTGYLGMTLAPARIKVGLEVRAVLPEGPADKAWIRPGDHLFTIDDQRLDIYSNVAQLLQNKVNQPVRLLVSPQTHFQAARYVTVTPVDESRIAQLRYQQWLSKRLRLVQEISQGKIVYFHLPEMERSVFGQLRQLVMEQAPKADGMILDIRHNGGGNIHQELIDLLTRRPFAMNKERKGEFQYQPSLYWDKPVVVLIDEFSFSDAEVFAHAFKVLKRGSLVGMPTSGWVIGTRHITLSNGAIFRVPQVGYYTLEGKNLEGSGVEPDYPVRETAEDRLADRDPQLLKAVEVLRGEIEARKKANTEKASAPAAPSKKN